jgi:hypothetical protein
MVWDDVGKAARRLRAHDGPTQTAFLGDGDRLVSAGSSGGSPTVRVWDLASGVNRVLHLRTDCWIDFGLATSRDGRQIAATLGAKTAPHYFITTWVDDLPVDPTALQRWMNAVTNARLDPGDL